MAAIKANCPTCNLNAQHERELAVEEFHNRLKRSVKLLACDVKPLPFMEAYARTLSAEDLRFLVKVLSIQVHQVVDAVREARR